MVRCAEATLRVVLSCKRGTLHVRIWRHPSHPDPAYVEKRCELSPAASGCWRVRGTAAGKSSNRLRRRFARRGVITLIYDKRTIGYSLLRRDYGLLAVDAAAAVALLATRRDVDPSRLGLWAQSEGAYVEPLACLRSSAVKFVITVGAVGVTQAVQAARG